MEFVSRAVPERGAAWNNKKRGIGGGEESEKEKKKKRKRKRKRSSKGVQRQGNPEGRLSRNAMMSASSQR